MIPNTVPSWIIPLGWIASGVLFTLLAHYHGKSRLLWGGLGFTIPLAAIFAYPASYVYSDRQDHQ